MLGFKSLEAKCVLADQGCTAQAQGSSFVDPTGKAKVGTVTGLIPGTFYDCYVVADPRVGKKDTCSKPVRIFTLTPPLVFYPALSTNSIGRKMLAGEIITTNRCFIGSGGNFTKCIDAGTVDTYILDGVVNPQKEWVVYPAFMLQSGLAVTDITTCSLSPLGRINTETCVSSYKPPENYVIEDLVADPLGRRVWFMISPAGGRRSLPAVSRGTSESFLGFESVNGILQRLKSKKDQAINESSFISMTASDDYLGTCAISPQGVLSECAQSVGVSVVNVAGPGRDASGFYIANSTAGSSNLAFCGNDLSLPCTPVSGLPANVDVYYLRFLTESVAYISGFNSTSYFLFTARCTVVDSAVFANCQVTMESSFGLQLLNAPANNGGNAYILTVDFIAPTVTNDVCIVEQGTGVFVNCTVLTPALPFALTSPVFSFPITFD